MYTFPEGYYRVADGDTIEAGDLVLAKGASMCGKECYGWKKVAPFLVGCEFFEGAIALGHPNILLRKVSHTL